MNAKRKAAGASGGHRKDLTPASYSGLSDWKRVNSQNPCPICGKTNWCLIAADGSAAICPRTEEGSVRDLGDAGYLHRIGPSGDFKPREIRLPGPRKRHNGFHRQAMNYQQTITPEQEQELSSLLGVSVASLRRLGMGWSPELELWTFPMRDGAGNIVGVHLRKANGFKLSLLGGTNGLFMPTGLVAPRGLFVCEGASDTAALLDLGVPVVGRPSCNSGNAYLADLVQRWEPRIVAIVPDNDEVKSNGARPGIDGARNLARDLALHVPKLKIVRLPNEFKDARQWKQAGATRADLLKLTNLTKPFRLAVEFKNEEET